MKILMKEARRPRHIPFRSCVVCGNKTAKRELIRVVRTPQGNIEVDLTGKMAGRGAYLCRSESCWDKNLKISRLEYVLKNSISQEELEALILQGRSLIQASV